MKLTNMPLPEPHLAGLVLGGALHFAFRRPLLPKARTSRLASWLLVAAGAGLAFWAVKAANDTDVARPERLVTEGPYGSSRNPMYIGWTLIYAGVALLTNSAWLLALLPGVALATHVVVLREERHLRSRFGEEYRRYASGVRRYV